MKINKKQCKCKRKEIILKWESSSLTKNLLRNIEKLKITISNSTKPLNDEIKRYKLILKPNIRERIIPSCLRHKCRRDCYKDHHFREVQQIKKKNENRTKCIHFKKYSRENLLHPQLKYDDISSGSLSSYEDIESLMCSTRMRMKELNEHWELVPPTSDLNTNNIGGSMNSLNTLILGNHEDPSNCQKNTAFYSPIKREDIINNEDNNVM